MIGYKKCKAERLCFSEVKMRRGHYTVKNCTNCSHVDLRTESLMSFNIKSKRFGGFHHPQHKIPKNSENLENTLFTRDKAANQYQMAMICKSTGGSALQKEILKQKPLQWLRITSNNPFQWTKCVFTANKKHMNQISKHHSLLWISGKNTGLMC